MVKTFSSAEIYSLYNKHIKKDVSYFVPTTKKEIQTLNFDYSINDKKYTFAPEGHCYSRIRCMLDFKSWIKRHNITNIKHLLATDISDPEVYFLKFQQHTEVLYNYETEENDLHTIKLEPNVYDFVLFSQTIEHLYNPFLALTNLYDATVKGGYIFTSLPTINIPHMTPIHFNGLTPMGLCMLFESVGFNTVEVGYWGTYDYIKTIFRKHTWPDYKHWLDWTGKIPNEEKNVAQTWILARK